MNNGDPEAARAALFEVIQNQIEANSPPETAQTLARLKSEGHSHEEAMKLIGCAISSEIFAVWEEHREYNEAAYLKALDALPKLPWE